MKEEREGEEPEAEAVPAEDLESSGEKGSEADECRDSLMRLQAEFENYKKRQAKERVEFRKSANEKVLKEVLPILDNLERALSHGEEGGGGEKFIEGVQLVTRQFRDSLSQFGVEPIESLGQAFDPHFHEAMSRVETDGDPPDGTVVDEYQKGYLLNGRVLRPALVGVAKLVDSAAEEDA